MTNSRGTFLQDPRLRGAYQQFLGKQSSTPRTPVGVDLNRPNQAHSARQGNYYASTANNQNRDQGRMTQDYYRNRSTEQASRSPAQASGVRRGYQMRTNGLGIG